VSASSRSDNSYSFLIEKRRHLVNGIKRESKHQLVTSVYIPATSPEQAVLLVVMVVAAMQACRFWADALATFSTLLHDLQIVMEDHQTTGINRRLLVHRLLVS